MVKDGLKKALRNIKLNKGYLCYDYSQYINVYFFQKIPLRFFRVETVTLLALKLKLNRFCVKLLHFFLYYLNSVPYLIVFLFF